MGVFRAVLVSPPIRRIRFNTSGIFPMQPLGLASLASYLRSRGIHVDILDAVAQRLSPAEAVRIIAVGDYDLAGFSATIFNLSVTNEISELLKKASPRTKTLVGGYGVVFPASILLQNMPSVDFFIKGEGERGILQLCRALEGHADLKSVPALIFRSSEVRGALTASIEALEATTGVQAATRGPMAITRGPAAVTRGPAAFTRGVPSGRRAVPADEKTEACQDFHENASENFLDLDSLPLPAFDLLDRGKYSMHPPFNVKPPICLVETARGCGHNCNFCSLSRVVRFRSVERVMDEIRWARRWFRAREIHFVDPTFTFNRDRTAEISEGIARNFPGLLWSCKSRVDTLDDELAGLMARSGCYNISLGVESCSQPMLDSLNKGVRLEHIEKTISSLKKHRIRTLAYVMFGAPGETHETFKESLETAIRLNPDFALFAPLMPDPLSKLCEEGIRDGRFTMEDIFRFYFRGSPAGTPFETRSLTGIPTDLLECWVNTAFTRFYLRPTYMAGRLLDIRTPREIFNLVSGALALLVDGFAGIQSRCP